MKHVLVFGTFDLLHPGHAFLFEEAKALGDKLTVVIARDATVEQVKGRAPHHSETDRLAAVQANEHVDAVSLGYLDDKYRIIEELKPDIIALGYDQQAFTESLEKELNNRGVQAQIVRLKPFKPEEHKSSILRRQLEK